MDDKLKIFTIGHSTQSQKDFLALIKKNHIDVVIDVRSTPYSRIAPQFNREDLKIFLKENHVIYGYMGDVLGARYTDPTVLTEDGQVDFSKVALLPSFNQGINRLFKGMPNYRIALMCSEQDPLTCHRFGLISKVLTDKGVEVYHITPVGLVSEKDLEEKLIQTYYKHIDVFFLTESPRDQAFKLLNKKIGYENDE